MRAGFFGLPGSPVENSVSCLWPGSPGAAKAPTSPSNDTKPMPRDPLNMYVSIWLQWLLCEPFEFGLTTFSSIAVPESGAGEGAVSAAFDSPVHS